MAAALVLFFAVIISAAVARAPVRYAKDGLQDRYVVVFDKNVSTADHKRNLEYFSRAHGISYLYTYSLAIKGFAAVMTPDQLLTVSTHPAVHYIEQDQLARIVDEQQTCSVQTLVDEVWGIDRISKPVLPLNQRYLYPTSAGSGVDAYIFDTGIYVAHNDFGGRARFGFKAETGWSDQDAHGHGTHVAGTVGGTTYGVAKNVALIAVKVLGDNGSGSFAGIIAGIEWALGQASGKPSVGNMSLQGPLFQALNDAVDAASLGGLIIVTAAGNAGANANSCNYSPSGSNFIINVGATTSTDVRASFSSVGTCLTLFAPGQNILSAWIGNPNAENIISGTSMASPHVCGAAALVLGDHPSYDFDSVKGVIVSNAIPDILTLNCGASNLCLVSPNLMLYTDPCGASH